MFKRLGKSDQLILQNGIIEGDETKKLYGFVEKTPENSYVCTGGTEISYRFENSVEIPLISQMNNFDWLSQYSATQKREPIITQEGYTLCSLNRDEFYGLGFTKNNVSCQQDKSVYWSNGSHWLFSANFRTYSFR